MAHEPMKSARHTEGPNTSFLGFLIGALVVVAAVIVWLAVSEHLTTPNAKTAVPIEEDRTLNGPAER